MPVAGSVLRGTDRGFALEATNSRVGEWFRFHVATRLVGPLLRLRPARERVAQLFAQTWIRYPHSPIVSGPHAGDRVRPARYPPTCVTASSCRSRPPTRPQRRSSPAGRWTSGSTCARRRTATSAWCARTATSASPGRPRAARLLGPGVRAGDVARLTCLVKVSQRRAVPGKDARTAVRGSARRHRRCGRLRVRATGVAGAFGQRGIDVGHGVPGRLVELDRARDRVAEQQRAVLAGREHHAQVAGVCPGEHSAVMPGRRGVPVDRPQPGSAGVGAEADGCAGPCPRRR